MADAPETSPFKLLDAYDEYDVGAFFGREQEIELVYNKLYASNLLLVYGLSGTGKTSLIRCGLSQRFRPMDWLPIHVQRGRNLNDALDRALEQVSITPFEEAASLSARVQSVFLDYYKRIFLIFDQFEELFLVDKSSTAEAQTFFANLQSLLVAGTEVKVILVIREEFLAHLTPFEDVIVDLFENRVRVESMRRKHLREVIQKTLAYHQIALEAPQAEAVDLILSKLESRRTGVVELTYLQVYLDRLWHNLMQGAPEAPSDEPAEVSEEGSEELLVFPRSLIERLDFDDMMDAFLREQLHTVEQELMHMGPSSPTPLPAQLPLKILYVLVTEEQTKRMLSFGEIRQNLHTELPETRELADEDLLFCLNRLLSLRILRTLNLPDPS